MSTQTFYEELHRHWFPTTSQISVPYRMKRSWEILLELKPTRLLDVGFEDVRHTYRMQQLLRVREITLTDIDSGRVADARAAGFEAFECDVSQSPLPFPDIPIRNKKSVDPRYDYLGNPWDAESCGRGPRCGGLEDGKAPTL